VCVCVCACRGFGSCIIRRHGHAPMFVLLASTVNRSRSLFGHVTISHVLHSVGRC